MTFTLFLTKKKKFDLKKDMFLSYDEKRIPFGAIGAIQANGYYKDSYQNKSLMEEFSSLIKLKKKDFFYLQNLVIASSERKNGLGRKLRTKMIKKILKRKVKIILTAIMPTNKSISLEKLKEFYVQNFYDCGAKKVLLEKSSFEGKEYYKAVALF